MIIKFIVNQIKLLSLVKIDISLRCSGLLLLFIILFKLPIAMAEFTIEASDLAAQYPKIIQPYINKAKIKLPPLMLERMKDVHIKLAFKTLNNGTQLGEHHSQQEIILDISVLTALINPNSLHLNPKDWDFYNSEKIKQMGLQSKEDLAIPKYKTVEDLLVGLLIHEIAHIYDGLQIVPKQYLKDAGQCVLSMYPGSTPPDSNLQKTCKKIEFVSSSVSTLKEYLASAWWPDRGFFTSEPMPINQLWQRSPDAYEWKSPQESFAVNMEFFLIDPEFKCQRPNLYNYLSTHFNNFEPFHETKCNATTQILVLNQKSLFTKGFSSPPLRLVNMDFNKLYAIHYLFASEDSSSVASSYGHSMIRLVFCAPSRKTLGPECLGDLSYHLVGNFQASIHDILTDPLKGLLGEYPTILFMSPLPEVIHEYSTTNWRNLYSLPLQFSTNDKINREQMKKVFDAILEAHWSYRGKYYYLASNCAHETFSIFKMGFLNNSKVFDAFEFNPKSLYNKLIELGIAQKEIFNDLNFAWNNGYYFPSGEQSYKDSLTILQNSMLIDPTLSLNDYLESSASQRHNWQINLIQKINITTNEKIKYLANFYNLENLILDRKYDQFTNQVTLSVQDNLDSLLTKSNTNPQLIKDVKNASTLIDKLISPSEVLELQSGYGIPNADDVKNQYSKLLKTDFIGRIQNVAEKIVNLENQLLPPEQSQQLELIMNNTSELRQQLELIKDQQKKMPSIEKQPWH